MGMVVRTNTMALNAYRQLGMNNSAVAKSLEKLSSGFRINRAGDDAAGLAISEKMKAQITGLETASSNAQDGISLIQTAEGNLTEVHSMLNRMVELATKSANGTYTDIERNALQDEVDSLLEEIDRISQSANFNGTNLLDGSLGNKMGAQFFEVDGAAKTNAVTIDKIAQSDLIKKNTASHWGEGTAAATGKQTFYVGNETEALANTSSGDATITIGYTDANGSTGTVTITIQGANATGNASITKAGLMSLLNTALTSTAASTASNGSGVSVTTGGAQITIQDSGATTTGKGFAASFDVKAGHDGEFIIEAKSQDPDAKVTSFAYNNFSDADLKKVQNLNEELNGSADTSSNHTGTNAAHGTKYVLGSEIKDEYHYTAGAEDNKGPYVHATADLDLASITHNAAIEINGIKYAFKDTTKGDLKGVDGYTVIEYDGTAADAAAQLAKKVGAAGGDDIVASYSGSGTVIKLMEDTNHALANEAAGATGASGTEAVNPMDFNTLVKGLDVELDAATADTTITLKDGDNGKKLSAGVTVTIGDQTFEFQKNATNVSSKENIFVELGDDAATNAQNLADAYNEKNGLSAGSTGYASVSGGKITFENKRFDELPAASYRGLTLQIGDTADQFNKMSVAINDMSAAGLKLNDLSIRSEAESSDAIARIKDAINTVSTARAGMGALQNRLEHTINNLDVAVENLNAANSRIRDTDMAKEMMNYTKMNVLVQSAQAMLAQANQQPQSVLQLLQ